MYLFLFEIFTDITAFNDTLMPLVGEQRNETYWIAEFNGGSDQAFAYFYKCYYQSLCYFAARLTQYEGEAKHIVADAFVSLWGKHAEFEVQAAIKSFLYSSVRGSCLNFLRDAKKKTAAQQLYLSQIAQNSDTILQEIIEAEFLELLAKEIRGLPEQCRVVFSMLYFEGKKTDEIAAELGLSVQTVRNHKTRAVQLLKVSLMKKGISRALLPFFLLLIDNF